MSDRDLVWYAAYGSNLSWERFRCYLQGGKPADGDRTYPGSRDRSEPRESRDGWLPYGFHFARRSTVWGGGVAFVDPATSGRLPVRLWLITREQFADVFAQENRLIDPPQLDERDATHSVRRVAASWYGTIVRGPDVEETAVLTFTAAEPAAAAAPTVPYLQTMAVGLRESHGWTTARTAEHLCASAGMEQWRPELLERALEGG